MAEPSDRPPSLVALSAAIVRGDRDAATEATRAAIAADEPAGSILDAATDAMGIVGHRFACKEIYVPEMLIAARAMKASMAVLDPVLVEVGIDPVATAVIGTVKGDLHDIGKNLVATMWRSARLRVVDLGVDVEPEKFAQAKYVFPAPQLWERK